MRKLNVSVKTNLNFLRSLSHEGIDTIKSKQGGFQTIRRFHTDPCPPFLNFQYSIGQPTHEKREIPLNRLK